MLFTIFGQERVRISSVYRTVFTLTIFRANCKKNFSDMTNIGWVEATLKFVKSLNTKLRDCPIWISPAKFQTLDVWFIVTRDYMLVKFGMDTEQILANATTIFWMHSFISGHKSWIYIKKPGFHTWQCSLPANIRRANHIAVALWLTSGAPPATRSSHVKGRQYRFTVNTQKGAPWCI